MLDKPLTPAGERILTVASELFYARGIRAVGVDLIAEEAGTTKKTLYDRFGSKDGLVQRYLTRRYALWCDHVTEFVDALEPGDTRILGVYDALDVWMRDNHRGCGFVNAFAEFGGTDSPVLAIIESEKAWTRSLFARLATEAGYPDAEQLGTRLSVLHEGAVVMGTAGARDDAIVVARGIASDLLAALAGARQ
ncbi:MULTISPECIES: TetR/AcrR family transcriptional regulator [unclassified Rhodococcus (in: high G+C Gram-positive bacteria)]|uniref:TetR/AcrR family transcriptional regulator n=1 Tax=unclassified Rhodococcus (in: high G+C Gram-positive bacteria) TaxID=192944 RepID=UPI0007BB7718|nr:MULTISPECIES: TetR/AcrR family transcriptional regulator [unclassified Rhodococcus (in: high G+C Gram-positive bacteria)]KZF03387.1 TetR family transcriptional regulator [Rhodococcus sp. EPR-279]KZF06090.1 TetR family transcriptional regulator [Rhodococcus sp. EPR-147]OZE23842.1 TetR/AcrR family transcriptional regulator [Rhodococcus sp. 05-2254-6]OZE37465.1 TetR/AcrR family transcriptional regulator [Rhodococcus sp. 05-2254-4]OZE40598.1 TetR/AcrR family transcriptional regulator [Rhodococc